MKHWILFFLSLVISTSLYSQNIRLQHIGIGYNISYAPLSRTNEFIDLYNASKTKVNGEVIDQDMKHIVGLTGIHFTTGIKVDKFIFDISWTKRSREVFANYELPYHDERHVKYRTSTLGFGALAPLVTYDKFSAYGGGSVDFVAGKLLTYLLDESPTREFHVLNSFGNFGIEPMLQLYYHPIEGIPLDLGCRMYWQMNLFNNDMSGLETEMYNHWEKDISELKSGGSNIGVIFQALVVIPGFKVKLPEKKVREEQPSLPQKITFFASVTDSATGRPVNAAITVANSQNVKTGMITENGKVKTNLYNNDTYTTTIEAFGYETKTDVVKLDNYPLESISRDYRMNMIKVGSTVTLNNIYFEKASAVLMSESMPELNKILQFMNNNPQMAVELSGHTSSEGRDDYNLQLSSDRANAIKQWLTSKGVDEKRIIAIGYGKTKPVADNSTEEGRKKNRRVELKIIKNE